MDKNRSCFSFLVMATEAAEPLEVLSHACRQLELCDDRAVIIAPSATKLDVLPLEVLTQV
jgi:hypothetical protein